MPAVGRRRYRVRCGKLSHTRWSGRVTSETWHISADGTTVRKLGEPGRRRDHTGQWRPIDRNNPGESPKRMRHDWWQDLRGVDGERPLAELYQRHDAGETLTGRDGERIFYDSVQGRAAFGVPVPKRSERDADLAARYAKAVADGMTPTEAARRIAQAEWPENLRAGEPHPREPDVWRAVRGQRENPPPRPILGAWTWDEHAAEYVPITVNVIR